MNESSGSAHDDRIARLEGALASAQADYLNLFDVLSAERAYYEHQIEDLTGDPYVRWMRKRRLTPQKAKTLTALALAMTEQPKISLLVIVRDDTAAALAETLDSLADQYYANWEAIVVDDGSLDRRIGSAIDARAARDGRLRPYRLERQTGGALTFAASKARGDFLGRVDVGDRLAPNALFEVALVLSTRADADVLYTDEDELDDRGERRNPHFKPGWSPESLLSRMYVGRLALYRRSLYEQIGGYRMAAAGAEDWDLALRAAEATERIEHVADVLYHGRRRAFAEKHDTAARRAINEAIVRRGENGVAVPVAHSPGTYVVRYALPKKPPRVSIVIPTRDHGSDVERCLNSIFEKSTYPDFEAIVVDNGSTDPASLSVFSEWAAREPRVRVLRVDEPFNFSRLNNRAVAAATGELIVCLNNDTEVRTVDWLEAMAEHAQRPAIGAVGAVLLYPNGTIQHAGVIVGVEPVARHAHKNALHGEPGPHMILHAINNYSAVTAACLMVRRSAYLEVGGFDESLAVAYNDVDLCLKLRRAGLRNVCLPHVVLYHFESKSRGADVSEPAARRFAAESSIVRDRWNIGSDQDPYYNPNLSWEREDYSIEA